MATKIKLGNGNWGVKDGGTLAYNDENGVFKAIELASSRASGATYVAESGLIADAEAGVPRIDWTNGVGELLLEPQSTNLCDISSVDAYPLSGTIIRTTGVGVSPTGDSDAVKLEKGSAGQEYLNLRVASTTLSATSDYTHSIFVKRDTADFTFRLEHNVSTNYGVAWNVSYTITDSGVTINSEANATGGVVDYGNGWYRVSATITTGTPSTAITSCLFRLDDTNGSGASILLQYHQFEKLSYPTSLIKTSGSAVTRIEDNVSKTGLLDTYLPSLEGSFFVDFTRKGNDPAVARGGVVYHRYSALRGMSLNWFLDELYFFTRNSTGQNIANIVIKTPFLIDERAKVCVVYSDNGGGLGSTSGVYSVFVNGVKVVTDNDYYAPQTNFTDLRLSYGANSGDDTEVSANAIREFKQYDNVLSDAEAIALTTI